MAEALGVAAGAAQFAGLAVKIIRAGHGICGQFQNAPTEIPRWLEDIKTLQVIVSDIESCPELQSDYVASDIKRCVGICQKISEAFDKIQFSADDPLLQKTWKAAVGHMKDAEIRNWFQELERIKSTLAMRVNIENLKQTREIRTVVHTLKNVSPGSDEDQCLRALFVTDPARDRDDIIDAKGDICAGTCKWILSTEEYITWLQDPSHPLWISAPPGVGKTFMSIYLSRHFERLSRENSDSAAIFFFCDNKKATRNTAVNILRGLISQLILHQQNLVNMMISKWKMQGPGLFEGSSLSILWKFFEEMVEQIEASTVYCIIDALDECEETSLATLLRKFEAVGRATSMKLRLICLSRRFPERIPEALGSFLKIELDMMTAGKEDIQIFISRRISELAQKKDIGPELQQHIEMTFREKSENTFLWVSFMVQDLENTNVENIEASLKLLPRGLDAIYERILATIKTPDKVVISEMLNWILAAVRPLRIPELCEAIHVQPTKRRTREEVCEALIKSCGHLLQLSRSNQMLWKVGSTCLNKTPMNWETSEVSYWYSHYSWEDAEPGNDTKDYWDIEVTFLHQSAKDYLQKGPKIIAKWGVGLTQQVHESISDCLIKNLCHYQGDCRWQRRKVRLVEHPLSNYAVSFWHHHFREVDNVKRVVKKNQQFFGNDSETRRILSNDIDGDNNPIPLLHMACMLGLDNLVTWLLPSNYERWFRPKDIDTRWGLFHKTALYLASEEGNERIISLLLDAGADPLAYCSQTNSPTLFQHAVRKSSANVLRMMAATKKCKKWLEKEKEARRSEHSLLQKAVEYGNEDACQFLIEEHGFDVNHGQPVHFALRIGNLELARRLVSEWHAEMPKDNDLVEILRGHFWDTATFEIILHFLIEEWYFDINSPDEDGCTIICKVLLYYSGIHTQETDECLEYMFELGFDPASHRRSAHHRGLIHCIAHQVAFAEAVEHGNIIEHIMGHTPTDINATCAQGQTVLHHYMSATALFRLDDLAYTFLWMESLQKYGSLALRRLLDLGADRLIKDGQGNTAIDIIKRALDRDFERDPDWGPGGWFHPHSRAYQDVVGALITTLESYTPATESDSEV